MKREISENQRLKERLIHQAEQARERAKKVPPGCERDASGGNHRTMAFLVRNEAVRLVSFGK